MGTGDERAVVMEARVAPALVMVQAQFPLELPIVEFDHPAQAGQTGEAFRLHDARLLERLEDSIDAEGALEAIVEVKRRGTISLDRLLQRLRRQN